MIAILAALALAASAPPGDATPTEDPAATLEQLQQIYEQSCAGREFGAYDDICDQLSHQVKAAQAEVNRAARRQAGDRGRATPPPQPPAPAAPAASAQPSAMPKGG